MRVPMCIFPILGLAADLLGQGPPGANVQLDIVVTSLSRIGDTTSITYVLTNKPASTEPLLGFTVDAPTVLSVSQPLPLDDWLRLARVRGNPSAHWTVLSSTRMAAGASSPPLTFSALGIPAIVNARVEGHYELPVYADAADAPVEEDPFAGHSVLVRVLGVGSKPPGASPRDLTVRLSGLRAESCALAWIDNHGICNSLQVKLNGAISAFENGNTNAALNTLDAFIHELDAQRGKHVNEMGYQLLKVNADVIRAEAGA